MEKKKHEKVETKPKSGRSIFNDRKRRELGRVVRANRRATLKEISQLISTKACEDTIRNDLKKLGYASHMAVKKSFLNEKQQKARYIFAKNHAHWTVDDWRKVILTSESSFEIGELSSQPRVWRKTLEKIQQIMPGANLQKRQNFCHGLGSHSWWKEVETCLYEERHKDKCRLHKPSL